MVTGDAQGCDLSIVIVSWNVQALLRACLMSIERCCHPAGRRDAQLRTFGEAGADASTLEVIVVDNGSADGSADKIAAAFPWVRLLRNEANLGFTRANNQGYALARGRFVYFLNPDTELINNKVHGNSLWRLYQVLQSDVQVGMAGPQLRYADNVLQESRRRFPTPMTGFFESTWLGLLWRRNPWTRRMHMADWRVNFRHDVEWLVGAALLCRRAALQAVMRPGDVGPFDEGFFMYSEEMDLAWRMRQAGWRIVYVPEALVIHFEGRSSEQAIAARHLHFNRSKVRFWRKWFGSGWSEPLRRWLLLEYRAQRVLERAKWLVGHKRALRQQRIEVYGQVLESKLKSD